MGDGSFAASSLMILQPGAAGNGLLASEAPGGPAEPCAFASTAATNGTADGQLSHSNGNSMHPPNAARQLPQDGICIQGWPGSSAQVQHQQWPAGAQLDAATAAAYVEQQQLQQLLWRQQDSNMQQQARVQVQLGAQMVQLHAQHNYRGQPAAAQPPSNGDQGLAQITKLQQMYAAQQQYAGRDQSQQEQQQQQLLYQQQQRQYLLHQQQGLVGKQQGAPAVSALRQSLCALQQQAPVQAHAQQAPGQAPQRLQQHQQDAVMLQHQEQQRQRHVHLAAQQGALLAAAAATQAQAQAPGQVGNVGQQPAQQHNAAKPTAFVPAGADCAPAQPQQQQQQVGEPALAEGPPSSNLTSRLTIQLVATYSKCSSAAGAPGAVVPRRILTLPAAGVKNNGWDNETSDLILATQVWRTLLFYTCR
jgi:hypothetical protein